MHEVETPAEGVTLAYRLEAGTVLDGHVLDRESSGAAGQGLNRTAEFDVSMIIKGADDSGTAFVKARIKNLRLNMSFGQMSDFVDAKAVISAAQSMVEGADIKFRMDARGVVTDFPKASAAGGELDPMVEMALEAILGALQRSIHPVPPEALTAGATWEDQKVTGRKGKLGRFKETTTSSVFKGLFRPKEAASDVQLALVQQEDKTTTVTTTKEGGHEVSNRDTVNLTFDVNGGFARRVQAVGTEVDGPSTTTTRFEARWSRRPKKAAPSVTSTSTSTQKIGDPCDPNYVGAELCPGAPDPYTDDFEDAPVASPADGATAPAQPKASEEVPAGDPDTPAGDPDTPAANADAAK